MDKKHQIWFTYLYIQVQFQNSYGGGNAPYKRSKLTDSSDICKGAIPLTLNHMEIWQTQSRLCGRAGEIPAISSISLRLNRPRIQASVLKGVRTNPFPIQYGFSIYFSRVLTYTTSSNTHPDYKPRCVLLCVNSAVPSDCNAKAASLSRPALRYIFKAITKGGSDMAKCKDCVHWDDGKCKTENRIKEYAEENCGEYVPVSITEEIFKAELENEEQRYLVRMLLKQIYCLKQELILCGSIMERSQCPDKITEMVRDDCLERIRRIIL